jgi:cation transporter-like permease
VLCNNNSLSVVHAITEPATFTTSKKYYNNNNIIMAAKKKSISNNNDATSSSSVMRELKDTIKTQAAEIDRLKNELLLAKKGGGGGAAVKKVKKVPSGGHAHGGGGDVDNEDILDYKEKSFISIAVERVPWLALFLLSLSFTAIIMNGFEHTLSKQIELAYFVPLMAGHGGNTGGQAVGTVLSALSAGVITRQDAIKVVGKEAASGLVMGFTLGALVGPISHYVMGISSHVATVVSVTFPLLSTIAAFLGSSLPFVCVILGLDPAVIAAPAMTSFVDVTGLLCYFLIANQIFRLFGLEL